MSRKREFEKVDWKRKAAPAIRIAFPGKEQLIYFGILRIAEKDFKKSQTWLARQVLADWLRMYAHKKENEPGAARQMSLRLTNPEKRKPTRAKVSPVNGARSQDNTP